LRSNHCKVLPLGMLRAETHAHQMQVGFDAEKDVRVPHRHPVIADLAIEPIKLDRERRDCLAVDVGLQARLDDPEAPIDGAEPVFDEPTVQPGRVAE